MENEKSQPGGMGFFPDGTDLDGEDFVCVARGDCVKRSPCRRMVVRPGVKVERGRDEYFEKAVEEADSVGDVLGTQLLASDFSKFRASLVKFSGDYDKYSEQFEVIDEVRNLIHSMLICLGKGKPEIIKPRAETLVDRAVWDKVRRVTRIDMVSGQTPLASLFRDVHRGALLASRLKIPNDSVAFRLWLSRSFVQESLRWRILNLFGEKLAGASFRSREVRVGLEDRGSHHSFGTVLASIGQLKEITENGSEFSLAIKRSTGDGCAVFYHLVPSKVFYDVNGASTSNVDVKIWSSRFFIPGRKAKVREILNHMSSFSLGTRFGLRDLAEVVFGEKDAGYKFVGKWVSDPLSQFVSSVEKDFGERLAAEKAEGEGSADECLRRLAEKDFTLRRMRRGSGPCMTVDVVLENRLVAMEQWINRMASTHTPLERVLWEMFQHEIGNEVGIGELAAKIGLSEAEVVRAIESGSKDRKSLFEKSKATMFTVVSCGEGRALKILL